MEVALQNDLIKTWKAYFPDEDLPLIGLTKVWALSFSHPCWIAGLLHDLFYPDAQGFVFHYLSKKETDLLFKLWWSACIAWQRKRNKKLCWLILFGEQKTFYLLVRLFKRKFIYHDKETFNDFGLSDRLKKRIAEGH